MSKVLIAGCGYVGQLLAEVLAESGDCVWAISRSAVKVCDRVNWLEADLLNDNLPPKLPSEEIEYVFFLAAPDGRSESLYRSVYLEAQRNLLRALRHSGMSPRRYFFASSTAVYHQRGGEWVDEMTPVRPVDYRGEVLLEAEGLANTYNVPSCSVRFGGIYGPGRDRMIRLALQDQLELPKDFPIYSNRMHRDDCAGMLAYLRTQSKVQELYLGVDDDPAERGEVYRYIAAALGREAPREVTWDESRRRELGQGKRGSNKRLKSEGFRLRFPTFREGYEAQLRER